ncbi:hypothetical protein VLK81_06115 [Citroniella saccharovorans]|uniref:DUF6873 domain-containing protein n=1 Tax=Citroniella saccharovorans TaxID=2053367 RepID=A0AAW9MU41_9FIRM|nr:hypothetical protein [Citroniella saccharovorans]MEB3429586.1 hypothetical protein [Citroniella saccharovorans]
MKYNFLNLPKALICSNKLDKKLIYLIESLGIKYIPSINNLNVNKNIMDHPDISIFELKKNNFLIAENLFLKYENLLKDYDLQLIRDNEDFSESYPNDSFLNVFKFQKYYLHTDKSSKILDKLMKNMSFKKLITKQGYSNCSCLNINDNIVITEDYSITKILNKENIKFLLVNKGEIKLPGFNYGFIGGSGIQLSDKLFLFSGNIKKLSYYDNLISILQKNELEPIYPDIDIVDFGGFVPIY